jgi:hypothetical protein
LGSFQELNDSTVVAVVTCTTKSEAAFSLGKQKLKTLVDTLTTRNMMMKTTFLMIMLSITTSAMGYLRGATDLRRNTRPELLGLSDNTLQVKEDVSTKTLNDAFLGVPDNTLQVKEDALTLKWNDTVLGLSDDDTLQVKEDVSTLTLNDTFENEMEDSRSGVLSMIVTVQSQGGITVAYQKPRKDHLSS